MDQNANLVHGLSPGHIVLHGEPDPPKGVQPPIFGPCIVAKRLPISTTTKHLLNDLILLAVRS